MFILDMSSFETPENLKRRHRTPSKPDAPMKPITESVEMRDTNGYENLNRALDFNTPTSRKSRRHKRARRSKKQRRTRSKTSKKRRK